MEEASQSWIYSFLLQNLDLHHLYIIIVKPEVENRGNFIMNILISYQNKGMNFEHGEMGYHLDQFAAPACSDMCTPA